LSARSFSRVFWHLVLLTTLSACAMIDADGKQAKLSAQMAQAAADRGGAALRLARAARDVRDYPAAIDLYKSAVGADPADTDTVVELGLVRLEAGQIAEAVATFQSVPASSKSQLNALLGLERASLMQSQHTKALEYADKAVALDGRSNAALVGRGVALDLLSRHHDAQTAYRAALAIAPDYIPARSDLALSLAVIGGYDEAIAIMTPIARAPSATPRLRQTLALIYGLKGNSAMARGLSRMDLDTATTEDNLKFFAMVRARNVR
jgi:tetratricopeptide (TPR) repeat protein